MGTGATLEVDYVSLLTDNGEVKTTEVSPSFSVSSSTTAWLEKSTAIWMSWEPIAKPMCAGW